MTWKRSKHGLLSVTGKVLEKLMINRISYHMRVNNCLSESQFGFTPGKSTTDAIRVVVNFIKNLRSTGRIGAIVSLDISSAFDHASWPAIIPTLIEHKVPNNLITLMRDYFRNRTSSARATKADTMGCPQGSACGPGLWNIMFGNILKLNLPSGCKLIAFDDDLLFLTEGREPESLQRDLNYSLGKILETGSDLK